MQTLFKSLAFAIIAAFLLLPTLAKAQDDDSNDDQASFQTFYDQLGDQGNWIQTNDYGYVWQPPVSDPDWAPYTEGHWVYTDDGWTWDSDESWGWATYHYGRWANIDGTGWVWIPGYRWAPAWVSWRYGGGYCGWAPLPPETFYGAEYGDPGFGIGFHFGGDVDVSFNIGAGCYNFIRVGYMGERDYHHHYENRYNNFGIINHTTNVTNINVNARGGHGNFSGISAGGPPINEINAHSQQQIQRANLTAATQPGRSNLHGNTMAVFAPRVNADSAKQARPGRVSQTINRPNFNRGDSITNPLAVSQSVRPTAPSSEAIQAAQMAQAQAPAHAKIATQNTRVNPTFDRPLSSLQPVGHSSHSAGNPGQSQFNASAQHNNAAVNAQVATPHVEQQTQQAQTFHPQQQQPSHQDYENQQQRIIEQLQHPNTQSQVEHSSQQTQTFHPQQSQGGSSEHHTESHTTAVSHPQSQSVPQSQTQTKKEESQPSQQSSTSSQTQQASAPQAPQGGGEGGGHQGGGNGGGGDHHH